ncbi:MAG: hypothetical protein Q9O62_08520 [Ardenticatenia bacterium]|nr:hypothetical protein [Ardenticatenia bacterium]
MVHDTPPWQALIAFLVTLILATRQQWSAEDLAWSFWLVGLLFGLIYLTVYHISQGETETFIPYLVFWIFFYFIFAGFLDMVFAQYSDTSRGIAPFVSIPAAIFHAVRARWPFLITAGVALLPEYILDARTVNFTDWGKPLIGRDLLRMVALIFCLMFITLFEAGTPALYPILFIYFLPWEHIRHIYRTVRKSL